MKTIVKGNYDEATEAFILPKGCYWDDDDLLHLSDGRLLDDGIYKLDDGSILMYEGIFETYGFGASDLDIVSFEED